MILSLILFGDLSEARMEQAMLSGFLSAFATAFSVGLTFLIRNLVTARRWPGAPGIAFWRLFIAILAVWLWLVAWLNAASLGLSAALPMPPACVPAVIVLFAFHASIISAPTATGQGVMNALEGLGFNLSVAEKDRPNMTAQPDMSLPRFERLLSYAVALGVEKPWSEHFTAWLETSAARPEHGYDPSWYSGQRFDRLSLSHSVSKAARDMAGSFSTSLPSSSSSSSGSSGGGSSGGGGGGGGGGGW